MAMTIADIIDRYGEPDPSIVSKLPKGGNKDRATWRDCRTCGGWHAPNAAHLDYVGHADITRILLEIDPHWNWEPVAWVDGRPAVHVVNAHAVMWARLTVLDKTVLAVGTAPADKAELDKELIGDFLRNAAMRLGIALKLWSKAEWNTTIASPATTTDDVPAAMMDDPLAWTENAMREATSVFALDAIATLAKARLTDEQRASVRPLYLERKAQLAGTN